MQTIQTDSPYSSAKSQRALEGTGLVKSSSELQTLAERLEKLVGLSNVIGAEAFGTAERILGSQPQDATATNTKSGAPHCRMAELHDLVSMLESNLSFLGKNIERLARL